jgi:cyclophilin family peptidyl-prolyl cis-trans isomerase
LEKRVNKKIFLQQFNLSGDLLFEIDVPKNVNRFIGYNEKKNEYYFWKQIFSRNVNGAVIYIFKPSPK